MADIIQSLPLTLQTDSKLQLGIGLQNVRRKERRRCRTTTGRSNSKETSLDSLDHSMTHVACVGFDRNARHHPSMAVELNLVMAWMVAPSAAKLARQRWVWAFLESAKRDSGQVWTHFSPLRIICFFCVLEKTLQKAAAHHHLGVHPSAAAAAFPSRQRSNPTRKSTLDETDDIANVDLAHGGVHTPQH